MESQVISFGTSLELHLDLIENQLHMMKEYVHNPFVLTFF